MGPTPSGVPVIMMSPASSAIKQAMKRQREAQIGAALALKVQIRELSMRTLGWD